MPEQALEFANRRFCYPYPGGISTREGVTWDTDHEDMLEFSKKFPDIVFCLHKIAEEDSDRWKSYYKDGKSQMCPVRFEYDEYDERKLK